MTRVPFTLHSAGGLLCLAVLLAASPARTTTADVTAVSLQPAAGHAELVIDLHGTVEVSDFILANPARLVIDLVGARLTAPVMLYDGIKRGGVKNVRYAQFRPDVVRVVVELDSARDYQVMQESLAVRVNIEGAQTFAVWSSEGGRSGSRLVNAPAAASQPVASSLPAAIPPRAVSPAPAASTAAPEAVFQGSQQPRISVTFDAASMQEVVATFAGLSGRSIVLGNIQAPGTVTAEIHDQPWDLAFKAILLSQGLDAAELTPGGIIRVGSRADINATDSLEPLLTRVIQINYAKASALAPSLIGVVSAHGKATPDTVTNSIVLTETRSRIAAIDSFIQSLDMRTPQVAIQARIVFVDRTELEDLGMRYDLSTTAQFYNDLIPATGRTGASTTNTGNPVVNLGGNSVAAVANAGAVITDGAPALKLVYTTVMGNFALTSFLEALTSVSLADIQAEPSVTVADNRSATIFSGEETPIRTIDASSATTGGAAPRATTAFKPTGIRLDVTPHVVAGTREIMMVLHAERSQIVASALSESGTIFSNQYANTNLLVRDGETAVIGGLTVTEITVSKSGIPFLVDLPVIGSLFGFRGNKEVRRDLLILVTPHIVDDISAAGTGGQIR